MPKGIVNKIYIDEFKQMVAKIMKKCHLGRKEVARRFQIDSHFVFENWVRICLEEEPDGLYIERRGRKSTGRPPRQVKPEV